MCPLISGSHLSTDLLPGSRILVEGIFALHQTPLRLRYGVDPLGHLPSHTLFSEKCPSTLSQLIGLLVRSWALLADQILSRNSTALISKGHCSSRPQRRA